ncbi:N-carbamoyl-L-amino-acid hydrolase [Nocardiopsis sp. Huas11]|uniref:allantoate amidohydrolase n=1 Tax=Nocardiopsis sp. Huas11 TaxID=2183912 RepID=UPI000EAD506B|nr:allantoate amidohydrolase [Nocardiopsis sp. Huas11]RKS07733.1 N-carbamoyl-L-amino-acid hydrolase [Nocardiopsis sp. Huas11]
MSFDRLWADLAPVGRTAGGGYRRFSWTGADTDARAWFTEAAAARGLDVRTDRNGNLWAWWGAPGPGAVATGSHLDSVPDGGAFDGPLGVASALAAVDELRRRGVAPARPLALVVFVEEEGGRFGVPCLGSRLSAGEIAPERARDLTDASGVTWERAMADAGLDPLAIGADPDTLGLLDAFVELHVEQGRALADTPHPVGVGSSIWPHGRWRMDFTGRADHAGTTRLTDRNDPMPPFAHAILAARSLAERHDARATVAKALISPNGTNAIPSLVSAWLDARAADEEALGAVVEGVREAAGQAAREHGVGLEMTNESRTPLVSFSHDLRDRLASVIGGGLPPSSDTGVPVLPARRPPSSGGASRGGGLPPSSDTKVPVLPARRPPSSGGASRGGGLPPSSDTGVPVLPTGAGHDAGVLAAHVPTAMLYVRNPTGVSHSPEEWARPDDCHAGVDALADVLQDLLTRPQGAVAR